MSTSTKENHLMPIPRTTTVANHIDRTAMLYLRRGTSRQAQQRYEAAVDELSVHLDMRSVVVHAAFIDADGALPARNVSMLTMREHVAQYLDRRPHEAFDLGTATEFKLSPQLNLKGQPPAPTAQPEVTIADVLRSAGFVLAITPPIIFAMIVKPARSFVARLVKPTLDKMSDIANKYETDPTEGTNHG